MQKQSWIRNGPFIWSMAVLYGCSKAVGTSCAKQLSSEFCWKCSTNSYKFHINNNIIIIIIIIIIIMSS